MRGPRAKLPAEGLGLRQRGITVSTVGLVRGIDQSSIKRSLLDRDILKTDEGGQPTVLVVDDDPAMRELLQVLLARGATPEGLPWAP